MKEIELITTIFKAYNYEMFEFEPNFIIYSLQFEIAWQMVIVDFNRKKFCILYTENGKSGLNQMKPWAKFSSPSDLHRSLLDYI